MTYTYACKSCNYNWDEMRPMAERDTPILLGCRNCGSPEVYRPVQPVAGRVTGDNAANGYGLRRESK